jgi:hypothetical protein
VDDVLSRRGLSVTRLQLRTPPVIHNGWGGFLGTAGCSIVNRFGVLTSVNLLRECKELVDSGALSGTSKGMTDVQSNKNGRRGRGLVQRQR